MYPDVLKVQEVAQRLGFSVRTVWLRAADGTLPAPFRLGRITRWRTRDIADHLSAHRHLSPKRPA